MPARVYIYAVVSVRDDDRCLVEALCLTPAEAYGIRKSLLANGETFRRVFVSAVGADTPARRRRRAALSSS